MKTASIEHLYTIYTDWTIPTLDECICFMEDLPIIFTLIEKCSLISKRSKFRLDVDTSAEVTHLPTPSLKTLKL